VRPVVSPASGLAEQATTDGAQVIAKDMRPVVEDDIEERGSIGVDTLAGVDGFSFATDRRALCHASVDVLAESDTQQLH